MRALRALRTRPDTQRVLRKWYLLLSATLTERKVQSSYKPNKNTQAVALWKNVSGSKKIWGKNRLLIKVAFYFQPTLPSFNSSTVNVMNLRVLLKMSTPEWPLKVIQKLSVISTQYSFHNTTRWPIFPFLRPCREIWICHISQPFTITKPYCFSNLYSCKNALCIHICT